MRSPPFRDAVIRPFDPWRSPLCTCPPKYSFQPYTGCSHGCLYCYATSYIGRRASVPKKRVVKRLVRDLSFIDPSLPISMSNSSDPYPPEERFYEVTRRCLEALVSHGARILIVTKGALVSRDVDLLSRGACAVTMTITTMDPGLASRLEPRASSPRERVEALERLSSAGIPVGIRLDPVIPGLNDDRHSIREVLEAASSAGARFVVTSSYKARPDNLKRMIAAFPELERLWIDIYRVRGRWVHGYWYAPAELRKRILRVVIEEARKLGMEYAVCREGFERSSEWYSAPTCDGTHLIPKKGVD